MCKCKNQTSSGGLEAVEQVDSLDVVGEGCVGH